MKHIYRRSSRTGAWEWLFQRVTGVLLVVALMGHYWVTHYFPGGHVTYEKVSARFLAAGAAWKIFDLTFLVLALFHGLNGIWTIVLDYVHHDGWRVVCYGALWFLGLVFLIFGSLTIITFQPVV